jgi:hypothetical protein
MWRDLFLVPLFYSVVPLSMLLLVLLYNQYYRQILTPDSGTSGKQTRAERMSRARLTPSVTTLLRKLSKKSRSKP